MGIESLADELDNSETKVYNYMDWLYNTGRLTAEEHSILMNNVADCVEAAIAFGTKG